MNFDPAVWSIASSATPLRSPPMSVCDETADSAVSRLWKLEALSRLDKAGKRCIRDGDDFEQCLGTILDTAIFVTAADKGKLQLIDPISGCLVIRAQRGFDQSRSEERR